MKIGNFWGIPMPVALVLFDDNRDQLYKDIIRLNDGISSSLLVDIRKELLALKQLISCCSWRMPDFDYVSDNKDRMTEVVNLRISGASEVENAQFLTELRFRILERMMKLEARGEYKDCSILETFDGVPDSFLIKDLNKVVRNAVGNALSADTPQIHTVAKKFNLIKTPPKEIYFNQQKVELDKEQIQIWDYYKNREAWIDKLLYACSTKKVEETKIFNRPFNDLICMKPISIKYSVMGAFDWVKDRALAKYLPSTRDECRAEITKFEKAIQKYVDTGEELPDAYVSYEEMLQCMRRHSPECQAFFYKYIDAEDPKILSLTKEDFEMLLEIFDLIHKGLPAFFNRLECAGNKKWIDKCLQIGVVGFTEKQLALFEQSVDGTVLTSNTRINKSADYLVELREHLQDIYALLDTLIPIGTKLEEEI